MSYGLPPWMFLKTRKNIRVKVELPGLKKNAIGLSIQGDTLIIKEKRKKEVEEKKENYHRVERAHGQFHHTINLPVPVKTDEVKAAFKDGILEVIFPKKEEAKARQIQVEIK